MSIVQDISHAISKAGSDVEHETKHISHKGKKATHTVSKAVKHVYHVTEHEANKDLQAASNGAQKLVNDTKHDIHEAAHQVAEEYGRAMKKLEEVWDVVSKEMTAEINVLEEVVMATDEFQKAKAAMQVIVKAMKEEYDFVAELGREACFSVKINAQADVGAGVLGNIGYVIDPNDLEKFAVFGSVCATAGIEIGANAGQSAGVVFELPKEYRGPGLDLLVNVAVGPGAGITVNWRTPSRELLSLSLVGSLGAETQAAAGADYKFVMYVDY